MEVKLLVDGKEVACVGESVTAKELYQNLLNALNQEIAKPLISHERVAALSDAIHTVSLLLTRV